MFQKLILIAFLFAGTHFYTIAQDQTVINPLSKAEIAFLDFITKDSANDLNLSLFKENFRFGFNSKIANGITLMKSKNKLWVQPMGSGRLYQIVKIDQSKYQLLRIDSTLHTGINFGSINWIHRDTLFQFGGIGFWRIKDHFTFFSNKTHEWELFSSNKRVPVYQSADNGVIYHMDQKAGKFYLSHSILQQDFPNTLTTLSDDTCMVFNFKDRTWTILGKLNPALKEIGKRSIDIKTNFGPYLLFHSDLELYWLNFSTNQFGSLSKNKQAEFREKWLDLYKGQPLHMFQFAMGSKYYLIRIEKDGHLTSHAITLEHKDMIDTDAQPIYSNSLINLFLNKIAPGRPIIGNAIVILIAFLIYALYKKRFKKKKIPIEVQSILYKNFYSALSIVEKELIQAIYQLQIKNEQISIKTINKIIGVQQKDTITQNKSRSDIFLRINQKFKLATRENEALVVKQREETDKRQYNYNINIIFIKQLEKLILNNQ